MFIAGHAIAGALIGQQIGEGAILIFLLAFISHFLLDLIPHGDHHHVVDFYFGKKQKLKALYSTIIVDAIATIIIVVTLLTFVNLNRVAVAWGVIGAVLPDLLVGLNELVKSSKTQWFTKFHFRIHNALVKKIKVKPLPGTIGQLIVIALMLVAF